MATNLEKLRGLLQELFQLDQADLDFGIYRIMNQKRDEVVRFLDKDLLPQVQAAFKHYKTADKSVLQGELDKLVANITSAGMNPDESPKVKELKKQIAESAVDVTALENEVFSHLFNFFRRYYSEGDFISLRRYKEGVYAIPYEGEEVKLHWANADQYYVKSSETFRDYTFKVAGGKRVRVHLVAASTEQDNNKPAQGKERRFVLAENPVSEENGELFVRFEYRPVEGKEKQDDLNKQAVQAILKSPGCKDWLAELGKLAPTEKNPNRTVLEKHLTQYTARNTFDYFIHKDLGGFLRRELDFYIKNEVMHLDDIEHESVPKVEQYLSQIKVIRSIAHKIIQFLEQLENFQKKLWLKKKFVIETNYCITLDRVPEELYPEIAANDAQREEWVRLFAIDEIKKDLHSPGYSKPLKVEFLKSNPQLPLDTRFFSPAFVWKLLASIENQSLQLTGLLVHSENFHALRLLTPTLRERLRCIYIDPPYNTGSDDFIYKDSYQHSSWLAMIHDRVREAVPLLLKNGVLLISIDDTEAPWLNVLLGQIWGRDRFLANFVWRRRVSSSLKQSWISSDHEYIAVCSPSPPEVEIRGEDRDMTKYNIDDGDGRKYASMQLTVGFNRFQRPNQWYELKNPRTGVGYWPPPNRVWGFYPPTMEQKIKEGRILFPDDYPEKKMTRPRYKAYPEDTKREHKPVSTWLAERGGESKVEYDESDCITLETGKNEEGTRYLRDTIGEVPTVFPKPVSLLTAMIEQFVPENDWVCDFFAGSGTTAHAVIERNRADETSRRFILVEAGKYFDTILLPRVLKAGYSEAWKEGKPTERNLGISQFIKYIRLESYEDALNNLELKRTDQQQTLLDADADLREQYILSYMLDVESRGSQSLLNVEAFRNPDEYKLRVERNGETQLVNVDLVETFNWLLGLTVKHIDVIRGVRVVEGTAPNGDRVLVLWRNIDQMDNDALDKWFEKQDYNTREMVYDVFYVNGDNNLENLRRPDQTWKVRLIEEEFKRLMFDVQDV